MKSRDDRAFQWDLEPGANVRDHARRCGRSERQYALSTQCAAGLGQLQIVGPKVVPPFRDAVRFIHGE